jgi:hypothetical protein
MPNAFARVAFTPSVRAAQTDDGSRPMLAAAYEGRGPEQGAALGPQEADWIAECDTAFVATVSETGWPYVQHRGGPRGFIKVLDAHTLGFADYAGNRQLVSVGNLAASDRVALLLIDTMQRRRLKLLGHARVQPLDADPALAALLVDPGYRARPQRALLIRVEAFDWNCPQHIVQKLDTIEVDRMLARRDARIAELEAKLAQRG